LSFCSDAQVEKPGRPVKSMLELSNIEFSYSSPILRNVSFGVGEGELLAVLGPNGSGKSTLLKLVVGILQPGNGVIEISGRRLNELSRREAARIIGYVPQESSTRFPFTTLEFVLQGRFAHGRMIGFESEEDAREATRAMELTETLEFASRKMSELSGGERQRVMLARAIASRPLLLVLDEPVANLDVSHQVKVLELVKRLTAERGLSAVVVTHELNLAAEFATRVLLLKSGTPIAFGPPDEVMTSEKLEKVFEADLLVDRNPVTGAPRITLLRRMTGIRQ
jgi:iron complex transport system ATP-binding protein